MSTYFQVEEYHRPQNISRAIDILSKFGNSARVIAGGTDILPRRAGVKKLDNFKHLVDISRLDLDYLKKDSGHISIGAATPINTIGLSALFSSGPCEALSEAASAHSTSTIRNRATVGGNLCNASACADFALPLLVLDAILVAAGPDGTRDIPIEKFFKGANYTALAADEILLEIRIPKFSQNTGAAFQKLRRQQTAIDTAIVNVATLVTCSRNSCESARIALGSVAPISFRAKKAESLLAGTEISDEIIKKASMVAAREARPIDDVRATAAYRKKMVAIFVRRSLENSIRRCGQ
ncbi:MAG: xanthine dehydrogenase family protein subunit M [bacterium]|nr:xanthine dehydrogenase family protein subunit M [bacterium]